MNYKKLEVWKEAMSLAEEVYSKLNKISLEKDFELVKQIRRSAISIPSNLAEGAGRYHKNDSLKYFIISRGSAFELETQILLAGRLEYITQVEVSVLLDKCGLVLRLLNGFINYYRKADLK
jgi:four helix bundle protein